MDSVYVSTIVGLTLMAAVSGQPALLTGRFVPTLGNNDVKSLPLVVSWPLSQVTVNFRDSTTVTVELVDSTYTPPFAFANLNQYVSFDAAGAKTSVVLDGNRARIQLSGLSGAQQTATLTKIDESSQGDWPDRPPAAHKQSTPRRFFHRWMICRKSGCGRLRARPWWQVNTQNTSLSSC